MSFPTAHECSAVVEPPPPPLLPSPPPATRASPRGCPPVRRAHGRRCGGLCSLLLSLLSDPSGSSDSLHSVTPSLLSLSLLLSVSVSLPPLRLSPPSLSCLVSFHRSQPRSRRVEGSALSAQTAATPGRPRTNLPALLLLPHGPASLRRCCRRRRRRRVEGDPDPTLFLRPDKKRTKKPTRRR